MQERKAGVFVIATSNDISKLPPEFLRAGRWDEIWFVDLPNMTERVEIGKVMATKYTACAKVNAEQVAKYSDGYTGAEIEQGYVDAMYRAFADNRTVESADVIAAMQTRIPLSVSAKEKIDGLRKWSKGRARNASKASESSSMESGRSIE